MPTSITYPGVYVEELPAGVSSIVGVPTSIAAFVGRAASGPVNDPVRVSSYADVENAFGSGEGDLHQAVRLFFANGGSTAFVVNVATEGEAQTAAELEGSRAQGTGLFALDKIDLFNILIVPGQSDQAVHAAIVQYANDRRAFAILDLPADVATPRQAEEWLGRNENLRNRNAAVYFPRLQIRASAGGTLSAPNSGAIAGVYARTDSAEGVWKAAAGRAAALREAIDLGIRMGSRENDRLNSLGINGLRAFGEDLVVWGARTLAGADAQASEWKYVPVRRFALFIEESLYRGMKWVVFEPNEEPLWAKIRLSAGTFLHSLFKQGAFQGATPKDAYFVKCDQATNAETDPGTVNIVVGFAPLKPAEFVVITLRQTACRANC